MSTQGIMRRPRAAAIALAVAVGLGGLAVKGAEQLGVINPPPTLKFANADEGPSHNSFAPVVKKVLPAVVNIQSSKMVKTAMQGGGDMEPFFRQFFGGNGDDDGSGMPNMPNMQRRFRAPQRQQKETGLGSGVSGQPERLHPDQQPRGGWRHHGDRDPADKARIQSSRGGHRSQDRHRRTQDRCRLNCPDRHRRFR